MAWSYFVWEGVGVLGVELLASAVETGGFVLEPLVSVVGEESDEVEDAPVDGLVEVEDAPVDGLVEVEAVSVDGLFEVESWVVGVSEVGRLPVASEAAAVPLARFFNACKTC
jgi:hypothetical protein